MSREILTQEEIDALLEGLGQGKEDGEAAIEDYASGIVDKVQELLQAEAITERLQRWEWSLVSASAIAEEEPLLWGEIQVLGAGYSRTYYYVDRRSLQSVREVSRAADMDNPARPVDDVVNVLCEALRLRLAQEKGRAVDVEPGPARTGDIADAVDTEESWFRVRLWLKSVDDSGWILNFVLPQEAVGAPAATVSREDRVHKEQEGTDPNEPGPVPGGARIQRAEFGQLGGDGEASPSESRIEMLMDVPLEVSVELGRTVCDIREVLSLGTGSILEMEKQAGEAVEVLVNGKLVARGEVVVVDENFAVRMTEIVSVRDRLEKLR